MRIGMGVGMKLEPEIEDGDKKPLCRWKIEKSFSRF